MPSKGASVCGCGHVVAALQLCACRRKRAQERNARADANRPSARRRGYDRSWEQARADFLRAHPHCVMCAEYGQRTLATVVDHRIPHRGDRPLFWDRGNWQALCTTHHASAKQAAEKRECA